MARERDFRQRAVTTANLLLEAASMLQESREQGGALNNRASSSFAQSNRTASSTSLRPAPTFQPSLNPISTAANPSLELPAYLTAIQLPASACRMRVPAAADNRKRQKYALGPKHGYALVVFEMMELQTLLKGQG